VLGVDPERGRSGWRERVGVLLQTTSVEPDLTVHEALRLYTGFYRGPRPVAELLDLLDLTDVRDRRAGRLSGGQQRRLDLALTIAGRPRLVFLDEPTTGFDPQARRRTWDLVRELAADGVTVVLSTHYLEEAAQLADRVLVLVGGRIVAEGDPGSLGGADLSQSTVRYRRDSELVELRTSTPTAVLAELTGRAAAAGTELADLTVTRPTLEDLYLELTGAHAR
jgi:ABC-2 type transport system ATP-binding protein